MGGRSASGMYCRKSIQYSPRRGVARLNPLRVSGHPGYQEGMGKKLVFGQCSHSHVCKNKDEDKDKENENGSE